MKKVITILVIFNSIIQLSIGQLDVFKSEKLTTSKLSFSVSNVGLCKSAHERSHIYFPYLENIRRQSDSATGICLSASTSDGELRSAYSFLAYEQFTEYAPGTINRSTGEAVLNQPYFDRIWKIDISQIEQHKIDFQNDQLSLSTMPIDIKEWPAKGNSNISAIIDYDLAPFFDQDGNDRYDPLKGDYPIAIVEKPTFTPSEFTFVVLV